VGKYNRIVEMFAAIKFKICLLLIIINTFTASYLNTQGLNNSCLKSRQRRP